LKILKGKNKRKIKKRSSSAPMAQVRNQVLLDLIAQRIKKFREAKAITQEVFYYDTNINLGRIENGQTNISVSTLEAICKYLNVSLKEFFSKDFDKIK
jgi:DNA-binding Xre family transcriptional regulator